MLKELGLPQKPTALEDVRHLLPDVSDGTEQEVHSENPLATWWQQRTSGTTYIRCTVPARHLPGNSYALKYSDLKIGPDGEVFMPRQEGVGIFQFVGNATRALLMAHQQEQGVKCLIEVDDNYLRPPPTKTEWRTRIDRSEQDHYSFQAHRKIVRWVDGIIASTDEIAERYAKHTSQPIWVCPNSMDLDDWPEVSKPAGSDGTGLNGRAIGFAGSGSHQYDIPLIEDALDWAYRLGANVYKIGGSTFRWRFPHEEMPWTDNLAEYRRNLQVLDVGLCPLKRGDWQDCKSDLKAMEYVLSGAVPIVSKVPSYKDWLDIVPSCETGKDWRKAVRWACTAPAEELQEVWERAYAFVLERKLISQHIDKWKEAIA